MATDIIFPLYDILVESIFGSVGFAIVGIAIVLAAILFITRTSSIFITRWLMFYFAVMGTLYIGAIALVFVFMLEFSLAIYKAIKIWGGG